ncbi:DUF3769 domain-containing protein [Cyanobacterium stanieri LEGE 03274]|uniref:DUF3769 domain-containing protein n=1 Tax=Cyanobacterium stanieri LEGE 03274 TaxID=1828756 RepID=A0ABR9V1W4_9CHRO|nr:DUF3769 domain-containing protein [Cyanobacterium stanieri]MBE9221875.1 DUF3769 domain-containing protein [Cyanobacterium stanieri LEGE 03274]
MIPILTSSLIAVSPVNVDFQEELTTINHQETIDLNTNNDGNLNDSLHKNSSLEQLSLQGLPNLELSPWLGIKNPQGVLNEVIGQERSLRWGSGQNNFSLAQSLDNDTVRLITSQRGGGKYQFDFNKHSHSFEIAQENDQPNRTIISDDLANVVEIVADEQEFLDQDNVVNARGNVVIRFANGVLAADQVSVNLNTRIAVAEGDVSLQRGEQLLRGDRFEYFFVQNEGTIENARGTIYQPTLDEDVSLGDTSSIRPALPFSGQIGTSGGSVSQVNSSGSLNLLLGSEDDLEALQNRLGIPVTEEDETITRLRFEAERVEFDGRDWKAFNIRVTNDPFSPPDLEVRAREATLTNISPFRDDLSADNARVVLDQSLSLPLFFSQFTFSSRRRRPFFFSVGFDGEDLGGLFIERDFNIYDKNDIVLSITPQFLVQRALFPDSIEDTNIPNPEDNGGLTNASSYGLVVKLDATFSERTELISTTHLTGLDLENFGDRLRANIRLNHKMGDLANPYRLTGEFTSRERLFNGSLGFQTVERSIGAIISSPNIPLGNSGYGLVYQGSIQNITADTDRLDLLGSGDRTDNETNLTRGQVAGLINGNIFLWRGESLPPTPNEGLKYTPVPVTPFVAITNGVTAIGNYYSNGDTQGSLTGSVGLQGQFGNFSRKTFDYTGFNVTYSQSLANSNSPFLFDRFTDSRVLSLGLNQQVYGPVRAGFQTFINLDTDEAISTDYIVEYSRRAYGILLRYNPVLEIGSVNFRISNFNWSGNTTSFDGRD